MIEGVRHLWATSSIRGRIIMITFGLALTGTVAGGLIKKATMDPPTELEKVTAQFGKENARFTFY